jgi:hypothetical protein
MEKEEYFDQLMKEAIQATKLEEPSPYFAEAVMQKIETIAKLPSDKPLVIKGGWVFVAAMITGIAVLSFYFNTPDLSLSRLNISKYFTIPEFKIRLSPPVEYSLLCLMLLILIQLPILKAYHNRQFRN